MFLEQVEDDHSNEREDDSSEEMEEIKVSKSPVARRLSFSPKFL
jgi:hypothetical protein